MQQLIIPASQMPPPRVCSPLNAGQHAVADFMLTRQVFYSVTAVITNREEPRRNLSPGARPKRGPRNGLSPPAGTLNRAQPRPYVPNGSYFLEARRGRAALYGRVEFTVAGAPVGGLNVPLLPMHGISVTVRKDLTAAANTGSGGGLIQYSGGNGAGVNATLVPAEEFADQMGSGGRMRPVPGVNDGSSFEIEDVAPGRYWVETFPFQGYVSSITSGGVDLAREPLSVDVGSTSARLRLRCAMTPVQFPGNSMGKPERPPALLPAKCGSPTSYAIPLYASSAQIVPRGADPTGQFTISNLPPGSYPRPCIRRTAGDRLSYC